MRIFLSRIIFTIIYFSKSIWCHFSLIYCQLRYPQKANVSLWEAGHSSSLGCEPGASPQDFMGWVWGWEWKELLSPAHFVAGSSVAFLRTSAERGKKEQGCCGSSDWHSIEVVCPRAANSMQA